jgi:hypothetical protein
MSNQVIIAGILWVLSSSPGQSMRVAAISGRLIGGLVLSR